MKKLSMVLSACVLLIAMILIPAMLTYVNVDLEIETKDPGYLTTKDDVIFFDSSISANYGKYFWEETQEIKDYHIVISSFGGSAFDCLSILERIEYLQSKGCWITTEVYGFAMSAGAYIFLAGDDRIADKDSTIMLHGARIGGHFGTTKDLHDFEKEFMKHGWNNETYENNEIDVKPDWSPHTMIELIDERFKNLLRLRTTLTEKEINHWLYFEDSNWMTGEEALLVGVANIER